VRADGPADAHAHRRSAMVPSDRTGAQVAAAGGASDKQHWQSAATEHARRARASWAAVDRVRPGALKLGGSAPGAREEAGAARAWSWPRAPLHIGPRVDWAALTSPRPEAGTWPRHPQLDPIRLRFGPGTWQPHAPDS
jgi:hypothetical protein